MCSVSLLREVKLSRKGLKTSPNSRFLVVIVSRILRSICAHLRSYFNLEIFEIHLGKVMLAPLNPKFVLKMVQKCLFAQQVGKLVISSFLRFRNLLCKMRRDAHLCLFEIHGKNGDKILGLVRAHSCSNLKSCLFHFWGLQEV